MDIKKKYSDLIKQKAKELKSGSHGEMTYMENYFDKRLNPALLVDGARSVISLTYNYYQPDSLPPDSYKISKYAYGEDYHHIIKDKLNLLFNYINDELTGISGRFFVDSAPVLERAWAKRSGLGWIGKNTNLITPRNGSFFFLTELIIDLELPPDERIGDYCGSCSLCIDYCPTEALSPHQIDAQKCISYFTIELKGRIPEEMKGKFEDWIFGCDICQNVCPWNKFSFNTGEPAFRPSVDIVNMTRHDWENLSEDTFSQLFKKSAVKRTKFSGLKRNIDFVGNKTSG